MDGPAMNPHTAIYHARAPFHLVSVVDVEEQMQAHMRRFKAQGLPWNDEYGGLDFSGDNELAIVNIEVTWSGLYLACEKSSPVNGRLGTFNNIAGHMQGDGSTFAVLATMLEELESESGIIPGEHDVLFIGEPFEYITQDARLLHCAPGRLVLAEPPRTITLNEEHVRSLWTTWPQYLELHHAGLVDRTHAAMESMTEQFFRTGFDASPRHLDFLS